MTSVPVPTFTPQDAWYDLTLGNLNPNIADTVPLAADLLPSTDSSGTPQDGIVGALDGGVIFLAGLTAKLDGGQKWLMWIAASLAVSDGVNVFCPFTDSTKPGRWLNAATATTQVITATQSIAQGATANITGTLAKIVIVFITAGSSAATQVTLPATTFVGQIVQVKDTTGNIAAHTVTIVGTVDGDTNITLSVDYAAASVVWNGTSWSAL